MPNSMVETPNGLLLIASGFDKMLRWDGMADEAEPAGVIAPLTKLTLSGSGIGGIVGTYTAYMRFVDEFGNYSNLTPVSDEYTAASSSGTITGATNASPIVITSVGHGLTSGARVEVVDVAGNRAANDVWDIVVIDADTFSLTDSAGNGDYIGGGTWNAGELTLTYSGLTSPTEAKVVRRQILRNTAGQATTYYVDIDTADLTSTSLTSTRIDQDLLAQESQAILDTNGDILANANGVPPDYKAYLAHHLDRVYAAGEVVYKEGNVGVTFGSTSVSGIGTEWTEVLPGRFLHVTGALKSHEISTVDPVAQTLVLLEPYSGPTNGYADYAIRPAPVERKTVYFSEAGKPESWSAINSFAIQEDGDIITGLMTKGSFLYILERKHIYRFTCQTSPKQDGYVFLSSLRGCINHRCWVHVEEMTFMLDESGVHAFGAGQDSEPVSQQITDIFAGYNPTWRINWLASRYFHAAHHAQEEVVRFFVALSGQYLPRHALAYDYRGKRWWIEEYAWPIGCNAKGRLNEQPQVFFGSEAKRTFAANMGTLDAVDQTLGTMRGTATAGALFTLTDSLATFPALTGVPVSIVDGKGKDQQRLISTNTATVLTLTQPWLDLPDITSVYQIGGIQYKYRSGWFRWGNRKEQSMPRRFELLFEPLTTPAVMLARTRRDRQKAFLPWELTVSAADNNGVGSTKGDNDLVIDLTRDIGFAQQRLDYHREQYTDGPRFVQWEVRGVQNQEPVTIYQLSIDGAGQGGQ